MRHENGEGCGGGGGGNKKKGNSAAASKRRQQQFVQEIERWDANHYKNPSPHWKVGLVIALQKQISKKIQGGQFECHVQWIDKCMDLSKEEFQASNLKGQFRPFAGRQAKTGSQLPHILINRPGDFGVISPLHILPVQIVLMTKLDFASRGVLEEDESQYSIKFCCLKTRLEQSSSSSSTLPDNKLLPEPDPDMWTHLNPPGIQSSSAGSGAGNLSFSGVPEPLEKAWKGWLQRSTVEASSSLNDALVKGWKSSRRERHKRAVLEEQAQRKAKEQEAAEFAAKQAASKKTAALSRKKSVSGRKENKVNNVRSGKKASNDTASKKRKSLQDAYDDKEHTTKAPKKKKGIRFSADTKQSSAVSETKATTKSTLQRKRARAQTKPPRPLKEMGRKKSFRKQNSDDGTVTVDGSTMTQETSSTDTTLPTRGAGRKPRATPQEDDEEEDTVVTLGSSTLGSHSDSLPNWSIVPTSPKQVLHTSKGKKYYGGILMTIDSVGLRQYLDDDFGALGSNTDFDMTLNIGVGSVVAIYCEQAVVSNDSWSPFEVPWGLAQVTSIFHDTDDVDDNDWIIGFKWFYRYSELSKTRQRMVEDTMSQMDGLVETLETGQCSAFSILPARIALTSDKSIFMGSRRLEFGAGDVPTIRFLCQHISHSKNKFTNLSDWSFDFAKNALDPAEPLSGPMTRAIGKSPRAVKQKFLDLLKPTGTGDLRSSFTPTRVIPASSSHLYEQWRRKFYDSIRLQAGTHSLHKGFQTKCTEWTLSVGNVIPLVSKSVEQDENYYPFQVSWYPAQVVSIYATEDGLWMMQVRWFYRFRDILEVHKEALRHLDCDHAVFETEVFEHVPIAKALPGRVVLTSNERQEEWSVRANSKTGLPMIPRLCTHICMDEEMDTSKDWTSYDVTLSTIPAALSRGLLMKPANRTKKEWILMLFRHYSKGIGSRGKDPDFADLLKLAGKGESKWVVPSYEFKADKTKVKTGNLLVMSKGREFFKSLLVTTPIHHLAAPTKDAKRSKSLAFHCSIGDIVCLFDESVKAVDVYAATTKSGSTWHPFNVPWTYGQITSIYKDSAREGLSTKVEIRRFFRTSQLPDEAVQFLSIDTDSKIEEVFETDVITDGVDPSRILGCAEMFLGHHATSGLCAKEQTQQHIVKCRCRYFYVSSVKKLQPLYCSSLVAADWLDDLHQRGCNQSHVIQKNSDLREAMDFNNASPSRRQSLLDLLSPRRTATKEGAVAKIGEAFQSSQPERSLYTKVTLHPQWSQFSNRDLMAVRNTASRNTWSLEIGDFVAVKDTEGSGDETSRYPFASPWAPCQILSIYRGTGQDRPNQISFEIRVLNFKKAGIGESLEITEPETPQVQNVTGQDLLGPLIVHARDRQPFTDLKTLQTHLPLAEFWVSSSDMIDPTAAFSLSKLYTSDDAKKLRHLVSLGKVASASKILFNSSEGANNAWPVNEPFRVDTSRGMAFYNELALKPHTIVEVAKRSTGKDGDGALMIHLGDVVLVRFNGPKRYPYDCNWGVADVVAIFKEQSNHSSKSSGKMRVEIRWFYERHDISNTVDQNNDDQEGICGEVFETDQTHIVLDPGNTILSTVKLVASKNEANESKDENGQQVFLCSRFWSTKRKSLIPCSGLEGRTKRAPLYSKCLPSDDNAQSATRFVSIGSKKVNKSWKEAMAGLQRKLTLKDASKHAYRRGDALVGRENEMSEILKFFRSAIRGDAGVGGVKSSMICAGPPGGGKTACVHAAITQLRVEQENGDIPKFDFIGLNGMEQRHPFDAYIRFWEALSGTKHVGGHDRACELLEEYFTTRRSPRDQTVTVVLLDEIDYLITEKQSVLYNFFDWPKRAANTPGGKRLVVIGVSNTLNLVEQLIPSVQSRVGTEKCIFKAYCLNDTVSILKAKIAEASK
ncbi:MAG: hypothetical protein SGILL_003883, partial [Bacillariaceae sp.]